MAGVVKSVEIFQITMGSGVGADTSPSKATLSGLQDIDFCVPFVTTHYTSGSADQFECTQVRAWFTSTDTLNVARDNAADSIVTEVSVVEFDSALCNVYSADFSIASTTPSQTATIPSAVDLSKSFLVFHSYQDSGTTADYTTHLIRGRFTSTNQITFDRGYALGTVDGTWFVVECKGTDFGVTPISMQMSGTSSASDTTTVDVDKSKSMLIGSWKGTSTDYNLPTDNSIDVTLTSGTQVDIQRHGNTGTIDWSGFVVEFADGTSVQHDTITDQAIVINPVDVDIAIPTPVSLTRSIAMPQGSMGSTCSGSSNAGGGGIRKMANVVQFTLEDSDAGGDFDNLRMRRSADINTTSFDISWSVIEFGTGGGAPPATASMVVCT